MSVDQVGRRVAVVDSVDDIAARRRRRQGSESRQLMGRLTVRCRQDKLDALAAVAGDQLPALIRECTDLLVELLPAADQRGVDPIDLLRHTMQAALASA